MAKNKDIEFNIGLMSCSISPEGRVKCTAAGGGLPIPCPSNTILDTPLGKMELEVTEGRDGICYLKGITAEVSEGTGLGEIGKGVRDTLDGLGI